MVASPNEQETVMDKFETRALSDDELDAVSGGDGVVVGAAPIAKANQQAAQQAAQAAENKRVGETIRTFAEALKGIT